MMMRCFLCYTIVSPEPATIDCPECGARFPSAGYDPDRLRAEAAAMMRRRRISIIGGRISGPSGWSMDIHAIRAAASRWGGVVRLPRWFRHLPARWICWPCRIDPAGDPVLSGRIALGCIARPGEADALVTFAEEYRHLFDRLAFVVDGSEADAAEIRRRVDRAAGGLCEVAVISVPLNDDFGAQRNHLQALADRPWVLHLDTDERPDSSLIRDLPAIAADADRWGNRIVSVPRINLVDGAPSAFYPDVQYRLVRSDIRFTRNVHETPLEGLHWREMQLSLAGQIEHRLTSEYVRARSIRYEAIAAGAGKPDDERLLLTPADADFTRPTTATPITLPSAPK